MRERTKFVSCVKRIFRGSTKTPVLSLPWHTWLVDLLLSSVGFPSVLVFVFQALQVTDGLFQIGGAAVEPGPKGTWENTVAFGGKPTAGVHFLRRSGLVCDDPGP
jgi:hypothetical protein